MKRYIYASDNSQHSLVTALATVINSTLGMDDDLYDVVEGLADMGGISLPENYDADKKLISLLTKYVKRRSDVISAFIIYSFTEYPDTLLEEISTSSPSGKESALYQAIETIYSEIGSFPGGDAVQQAIEDNIFNNTLVEGNASEIGYKIGQLYWSYITSPKYGVRTNSAASIGLSVGCRNALGGKYVYAFAKEISSYYYSELRDQNPSMPTATGYMLKFYNKDNAVCADVFNLFSVSNGRYVEWEIGDHVLHTFTITEFDDATIDAVAHEIAEWYDDHVQEAIDSAVAYN